jgi:hypothetical protein
MNMPEYFKVAWAKQQLASNGSFSEAEMVKTLKTVADRLDWLAGTCHVLGNLVQVAREDPGLVKSAFSKAGKHRPPRRR